MTKLQDINTKGSSTGEFYPLFLDQLSADEKKYLRVDKAGNLVSRSAILTDEGGFYDPFLGSTLSDSWTVTQEGSGTSYLVENSKLKLLSGQTTGGCIHLVRPVDFAPITFTATVSLSQQIANQDIYIGYGDTTGDFDGDTMFARFHFSGTDNTQLRCETQSSVDTGGSEGTATYYTIPFGYTSDENLQYRITNDGEKVRFYIGKTLDTLELIATHSIQIPNPYTIMNSKIQVLNGTNPASSTTIEIDTIIVSNMNIVDTQSEVSGHVLSSQKVIASIVNSTSTNLDPDEIFVGRTESTLGVAGIQISLKTDVDCLIYVEQSPNGVNWDISDEIPYYASINNFGQTLQAISSFLRIRIKNISTVASTYLRFQTALCPSVEVLPRRLDDEGHLVVHNFGTEDKYGFAQENTPMGDLRVVEPVRLVGTVFEDTVIDTNYWTYSNSGSGSSVTQANTQIVLTPGLSSGNIASVHSVRRARYVSGSSMRYRAVVQLNDVATTNNKRRWGVGYGASLPTITNGAYFQINNDVFSVVLNKNGSETVVSSGSFNGRFGDVHKLSTNVQTYEIYWTNSKVWFIVDDEIIHTFSADTETWSSTMNFHVFLDTTNTGVVGASSPILCRTASIYRLGRLENAPVWRNINTTTTNGLVLKRGAGRLHSINLNTIPNGTSISVYDSLTTTNPIAIIVPPNGAMPFLMNYDLDFYTGLTISTTPASVNITVVYE